MAELYPSDAELNALSGSSDSEQEVLYVTTGESPYYTSFYKMLQRLLKVSRRAGDLRVFKDADLTFGVRAGKYYNGDSLISYTQVTAQALTNNATNYIYLTAAGALTVNTTGFPVPSTTPHIPLATITTAAGVYDGRDVSEGGAITDYRGCGFLGVVSGATAALLAEAAAFFAATDITGAEAEELTDGSTTAKHKHNLAAGAADVTATAAQLNEAGTFFNATDITGAEAEILTDGSNADAKHVHAAAGITDGAVAVAELAAAVQDLVPNLVITAGAEAADSRLITIQARDAANNELTEYFRVRLWIATSDYGAPSATGNTYALVGGTALRTLTANADYEVISNGGGGVGFTLTISGAATRYIMAEVDGRIYSSGVLTWAA